MTFEHVWTTENEPTQLIIQDRIDVIWHADTGVPRVEIWGAEGVVDGVRCEVSDSRAIFRGYGIRCEDWHVCKRLEGSTAFRIVCLGLCRDDLLMECQQFTSTYHTVPHHADLLHV